jgi:hypothetical protein
MSLPQNLGRLSAALTSDASLNIGVGVTPSGTHKLEVGTTSKFTGVATFGSTLSNGTYSYTLPSATGTLALTSALSGYLPLTGGTLTGALAGTSATFSGDLTIDTNTLYVDSTNNNVGIGTTSMSSFNAIANQLVVGNGTANQGITISTSTTTLGSLLFADSTVGADAYRGYVQYDHSLDKMSLATNGVAKLTIASTGAATFSSSVTAGDSIRINKSSNSGSASTFPVLEIKNSLATQGDGSSTFNFASLYVNSGNDAVNMVVSTTYAAGTWAPAGIIAVTTNHGLQFKTNNTLALTIASTGAATFINGAAKLFEIASNTATGGYTRFTYNTSTSIGYIGSSSQLSGLGIVSDLELRADNNLFLTTTGGSLKLASTGAATFSSNLTLGSGATLYMTAGDIQFVSNAGYGILTADSNRLISIQNGAFGVNGAATFSSTIAASGRISTSHSTSGDYAAVFYNSSATGEGVTVRGGSTASHNAFIVQPYNGATTLFNILATGAATFSSSVKINTTNGAGNFITLNDGNVAFGAALGLGSSGDFVISAVQDSTLYEAIRVVRTTREVLIGGSTDQGAYNLQCNGTGVWGAGAYVNGSDLRLKEDIKPILSGLDYVNKMNPVSFKYLESYSRDRNIQTGFIAQELIEVFKDEEWVDGIVKQGTEHYNVAYQAIIPVLVKAIQELKAEVDLLKGEPIIPTDNNLE